MTPGEAGKLRAGINNAGLITMVGITGSALNRRRKHNIRMEKWGWLIEARGQWYVTPDGEAALAKYTKAKRDARKGRRGAHNAKP